MAGLFDRLKKTRDSQAEQLQSRLEKQGLSGGGNFNDPRFWKHTWNKDGISENVIRFLPIPMVDMEAVERGDADESLLTPMACIIKHQFRGKGGFYSENSLMTFGEDCPVRDHDMPLWAHQKETKDDSLKEVLKERIGKDEFICNILVIEDGTNPENNGKVFLYKVPYTIKKNFIDTAGKPQFKDDPSFDPFNLWEGANLKLNLVGEQREFNGWKGLVPKWDKVKWDNPSALGTDEEIERVWQQEHSIIEFYDRKHFKTYEELEARLRKVLAIPDGVPLVENGVGSVAHAPSAPKTPEPARAAAQSNKLDKSEPTEPVQGTASTPQTNAGQSEGSVEDFEKWLND